MIFLISWDEEKDSAGGNGHPEVKRCRGCPRLGQADGNCPLPRASPLSSRGPSPEEDQGSLHLLSRSDKTTQEAEDPQGYPTQAGAPCSALGSGSSDSVTSQAGRRCRRPEFDPWVRKIPWRRKWQPTPVLLPGKFHGQRGPAGYSPRGRKEVDTTEVTQQACRLAVPTLGHSPATERPHCEWQRTSPGCTVSQAWQQRGAFLLRQPRTGTAWRASLGHASPKARGWGPRGTEPQGLQGAGSVGEGPSPCTG